MTDAEIIDKLLAACGAYHDALDQAFAMLIEVTRGAPAEPFMPSKSPLWPTIAAGHETMLLVRAELERRKAP